MKQKRIILHIKVILLRYLQLQLEKLIKALFTLETRVSYKQALKLIKALIGKLKLPLNRSFKVINIKLKAIYMNSLVNRKHINFIKALTRFSARRFD